MFSQLLFTIFVLVTNFLAITGLVDIEIAGIAWISFVFLQFFPACDDLPNRTQDLFSAMAFFCFLSETQPG